MPRRNIDIPDELWRRVAIGAAKEGKTKRQVVVEAIELFLRGSEGDKQNTEDHPTRKR